MEKREIRRQIEIMADEIFILINRMTSLIEDSKNRYPHLNGISVEILESLHQGDPRMGPVIELPIELGIRLPNSQIYLIRIDYNTLQLLIYKDFYSSNSEEAQFVLNVVSLSETEGAG